MSESGESLESLRRSLRQLMDKHNKAVSRSRELGHRLQEHYDMFDELVGAPPAHGSPRVMSRRGSTSSSGSGGGAGAMGANASTHTPRIRDPELFKRAWQDAVAMTPTHERLNALESELRVATGDRHYDETSSIASISSFDSGPLSPIPESPSLFAAKRRHRNEMAAHTADSGEFATRTALHVLDAMKEIKRQRELDLIQHKEREEQLQREIQLLQMRSDISGSHDKAPQEDDDALSAEREALAAQKEALAAEREALEAEKEAFDTEQRALAEATREFKEARAAPRAPDAQAQSVARLKEDNWNLEVALSELEAKSKSQQDAIARLEKAAKANQTKLAQAADASDVRDVELANTRTALERLKAQSDAQIRSLKNAAADHTRDRDQLAAQVDSLTAQLSLARTVGRRRAGLTDSKSELVEKDDLSASPGTPDVRENAAAAPSTPGAADVPAQVAAANEEIRRLKALLSAKEKTISQMHTRSIPNLRKPKSTENEQDAQSSGESDVESSIESEDVQKPARKKHIFPTRANRAARIAKPASRAARSAEPERPASSLAQLAHDDAVTRDHTALMEKYNALVAEKESLVEKLNALSADRESLLEKYNALASDKDSLLDKHNAVAESHAQELADLGSSHARDLHSINDRHAKEADKMRADFAKAIEQSEEALRKSLDKAHQDDLNAQAASLKDTHNREIARISAKHTRALQAQASTHEAALASARSEHKRAADGLRDAHVRQLDALRRTQADERDRIHSAHLRDIEALEAAHARDVAQLKAARAGDIESHTEAHAADVALLKRVHASELDSLRENLAQSHASSIDDLKQSHASVLDSVRAEHSSTVDKLKKEHSTTVDNLKKEHSTTVDNLKKEHSTTVDKLKKDHSATVDSLKKDHSVTLDNLKKDHSSAVQALHKDLSSSDTLKKEHASAIETLKKDHTSAIETLKKDHTSAIGTLKKDHASAIETLKKDHTQELTALDESHAAKASALTEQLSKLQASHDEAANELDELRSSTHIELMEAHSAAAAAAMDAERAQSDVAILRERLQAAESRGSVDAEEARAAKEQGDRELIAALAELETAKATIEELRAAKAKLQDAAREHLGVTSDLSAAKNDLAKEKRLNETLEAHIASVKDEIRNLSAAHENVLATLKAEHQAALDKAHASHARALRHAETSHQQQSAELARDVARLEAEVESALERKEALEAQVAAIQRDHAESTRRDRESSAQNVEAIRSETLANTQRIQDILRQRSQDIELLEAKLSEYSRELLQVHESHKEELRKVRAEAFAAANASSAAASAKKPAKKTSFVLADSREPDENVPPVPEAPKSSRSIPTMPSSSTHEQQTMPASSTYEQQGTDLKNSPSALLARAVSEANMHMNLSHSPTGEPLVEAAQARQPPLPMTQSLISSLADAGALPKSKSRSSSQQSWQLDLPPQSAFPESSSQRSLSQKSLSHVLTGVSSDALAKASETIARAASEGPKRSPPKEKHPADTAVLVRTPPTPKHARRSAGSGGTAVIHRMPRPDVPPVPANPNVQAPRGDRLSRVPSSERMRKSMSASHAPPASGSRYSLAVYARSGDKIHDKLSRASLPVDAMGPRSPNLANELSPDVDANLEFSPASGVTSSGYATTDSAAYQPLSLAFNRGLRIANVGDNDEDPSHVDSLPHSASQPKPWSPSVQDVEADDEASDDEQELSTPAENAATGKAEPAHEYDQDSVNSDDDAARLTLPSSVGKQAGLAPSASLSVPASLAASTAPQAAAASKLGARDHTALPHVQEELASDADSSIIEAVHQTIIGESLYKFVRRALGSGFADRPHSRFFWIHPYTRALYWSADEPIQNRTHQTMSKSVYIVRVREIEASVPAGRCPRQIIVSTPERDLKLEAPTIHRHHLWMLALDYIATHPAIYKPSQVVSSQSVRDLANTSPSVTTLVDSNRDLVNTVQRSLRASASIEFPRQLS